MMLLAMAAAAMPVCREVPLPQAVEAYAALIRRQDNASIAHLFGADGVIDNPSAAPIRGEAAILAMLSGFKGAVVKSEALTIGAVAAEGGDWRVTGKFHQTGVGPEGKDYDVSGSFDSTWACTSDGWRVRRMATGE